MKQQGRISGMFVSRLCLWWIAGSFDALYIHLSGYEGTDTLSALKFSSWALYLLLGLVASFISMIFEGFSIKGRTPDNGKFHNLWWDAFFIFLITIGFRINQVHLPSFAEMKSILGNLLIILVAIIIAWLCNIIIRRLGNLWTEKTLVAIAVLMAGVSIFIIREPASEEIDTGKPNIILITLDTVRADHLGCYGYEWDTSPILDQFADDNSLFTSCRTPMPLTSPAHASLFSGEMPHEHGVLTNISAYQGNSDLPTIAEELGDSGYRSIGFPAAVHLGKEFNFDRGFDIYNQSTVLTIPGLLQSIYQLAPIAISSRLGIVQETWLTRDSRQVNQAFYHWLDSSYEGDNSPPFFAWLHYFDAHSPYQPPDEYWQEFDPDYAGSVTGSQEECDTINAQLENTNNGETLPDGFSEEDIDHLIARYDGEIRYQDESLGQLFDVLMQKGIWENSVIIIVSDHGEGMYDDGYFGHNFTLEEYEIRVACVIKGPDILCPQDRPLSLTDINSYISYAAGLADSDECRITTTEESGEMNDDPYTSMVFLQSHCWIDSPYKLVRTWLGDGGGGVQYSLYNFVRDPSEDSDILDLSGETTLSMKNDLQEWLEINDADFPSLLSRENTLSDIDPSTLEMLRSLGYIY